MTEYECDKIICSNASNLNSLLRADLNSSVEGTKSVKTKIAEGTKTQCKKWVRTALYKKGDIIAVNQLLYVAQVDNSDKYPVYNQAEWTVLLLPYTANANKLKGYLIVKQNADGTFTILKSYNIDYCIIENTYVTAYFLNSDLYVSAILDGPTETLDIEPVSNTFQHRAYSYPSFTRIWLSANYVQPMPGALGNYSNRVENAKEPIYQFVFYNNKSLIPA